MAIKNYNNKLVFYSATYSTRLVVRRIAELLGYNKTEYDITKAIPEVDNISDSNDLLIVGVPVYAGRIPVQAAEALMKFKGNKTPAIIVCVYGNRDYDDALLELKDIVESNGFKVISAGAFIAQHSIFSQVGMNRPDEEDMVLIDQFTEKNVQILDSLTDLTILPDIQIKGNRPYKITGKIPLKPKGNRKCTECGTCVKLCPEGAIYMETPRKTDKEKCIACGRCIVVCPANARHFGGLLYKIAGKKFIKNFSVRREPEMKYIQL